MDLKLTPGVPHTWSHRFLKPMQSWILWIQLNPLDPLASDGKPLLSFYLSYCYFFMFVSYCLSVYVLLHSFTLLYNYLGHLIFFPRQTIFYSSSVTNYMLVYAEMLYYYIDVIFKWVNSIVTQKPCHRDEFRFSHILQDIQ